MKTKCNCDPGLDSEPGTKTAVKGIVTTNGEL